MVSPTVEKFGIKETKEMVDFLVSVVQACIDSAADGKISLWDLKNFLNPARKMGAAFKDSTKIAQELSDLSDAEIKELTELVAEGITLESKTIEGFVEQAVSVVLELLKFVPFVESVKKS